MQPLRLDVLSHSQLPMITSMISLPLPAVSRSAGVLVTGVMDIVPSTLSRTPVRLAIDKHSTNLLTVD